MELIGLMQVFKLGGDLAIWCKNESPMRIIRTCGVQDESLSLMKEEHAAEHIMPADIFNHIWTGFLVPRGNSKMMIAEAVVFTQVGLCACE